MSTSLRIVSRLSNAVMAAALALAPVVALAQEPAPGTQPAPAAEAVPDRPLKGVINAVEGKVQVRMAEDQPWQPATAGMELTQGAEFRTGLRSSVTFTVEPKQTITLDRLGTVKLIRAVAEQGKVKTDVGMKYGRTRYDVEAGAIEHESKIHSPNATLAIRGTDVELFDQGFYDWARSYHGRAQVRFEQAGRYFVAFGGNRQVEMSNETPNPAEDAIRRTAVDPRFWASRDDVENGLINDLPSLAGNDLQARSLPGGVSSPFDAADDIVNSNAGFLAGTLEFLLTWDNPTADLDLFVISPFGEKLANKNNSSLQGYSNRALISHGQVSPTGGEVDPDVDGAVRSEKVKWNFGANSRFPRGTYTVGVSLANEGTTTGVVNFQITGTATPPVGTQLVIPINGSLNAHAGDNLEVGPVRIPPTNTTVGP